MNCPSLEKLAAWYLNDTDDGRSGDVEEHIFSCDRCADRAERMATLVEHLRTRLPFILTPERRKVFEQATGDLPTSPVSPGTSAVLQFRKGTDIAFWLLRCDLSGVERVDCALLTEDGATTLLSLPDVPFDAERQEVVLACHVHYRQLGTEPMLARLTSVDGSGDSKTAEYRLIHHFPDP